MAARSRIAAIARCTIGQHVPPRAGEAEIEERLVEHDPHVDAGPPQPGQPSAERHVQAARAERARHVLREDDAGLGRQRRLQHAAAARAEAVRQTMDDHAAGRRRSRRRRPGPRIPDVHAVTGVGEAGRDERGVVADAAARRREFRA